MLKSSSAINCWPAVGPALSPSAAEQCRLQVGQHDLPCFVLTSLCPLDETLYTYKYVPVIVRTRYVYHYAYSTYLYIFVHIYVHDTYQYVLVGAVGL